MQSKLQAPVSLLCYDTNQGCAVPSSNIPKNVVAKYTWLTPDVISVLLGLQKPAVNAVEAVLTPLRLLAALVSYL